MDIFDINNGQKIKELKQFVEILDAIVSNHEQQIKDLAAQLLELKQSTAMFKPGMSVTQGDVTPIMQFKRREWVGLTDDEIEYLRNDQPWWMVRDIEAKLREKNGG